MKVNINKAKFGAKDNTYGKVEKCMKDFGLMDIKKGMEYGRESGVIVMSDSGRPTSLMDLVNMSGVTKISMKESGKHVFVMGKESTSLLLVILIWVSITGARLKAMASTDGPMEISILVSSLMGRSMVKDIGRRTLR